MKNRTDYGFPIDRRELPKYTRVEEQVKTIDASFQMTEFPQVIKLEDRKGKQTYN